MRVFTHLEFRSSIIQKLTILNCSFIMFSMVGCYCHKADFQSPGVTLQSKPQLDQAINTQHCLLYTSPSPRD